MERQISGLLFLKDIQFHRIRDPILWPHWTFITSWRLQIPTTPCGLWLQHMNLGEGGAVHNSIRDSTWLVWRRLPLPASLETRSQILINVIEKNVIRQFSGNLLQKTAFIFLILLSFKYSSLLFPPPQPNPQSSPYPSHFHPSLFLSMCPL